MFSGITYKKITDKKSKTLTYTTKGYGNFVYANASYVALPGETGYITVKTTSGHEAKTMFKVPNIAL